jgi:membrane protease YdiL (CAAX protease family)
MTMNSGVSVENPASANRVGAPVAGALHTMVLLLILATSSSLMYFSAQRLRELEHPNRLALYGTTVAWEWLLTTYVLFGVRLHGTSLAEVTGARWNSAKEVFRDIGIALAFWICALVVLALTAHLLQFRGSRQSVSFLAPEGAAQIAAWVAVCVTAGFCEETIFRGYLQKQFVAWTNNAKAGVLLSAAVFGVCHIYQGVKSALVITVFGSLFGILAQWRKSLRPGMITHALHDTASGLAVRFLIN